MWSDVTTFKTKNPNSIESAILSKEITVTLLKRSFMNGVSQRVLNFFTEGHAMDLVQVTSTGCVTTKGGCLSLSRTQVDMRLEALLLFLGQALIHTNMHQAHSFSHSQTCTEHNPQSFLSKMKMIIKLFTMVAIMGQC